MNAAPRRQRIFLRLLAFSLLLVLGGCMTTGGPASVSGTCGLFDAPKYAIRGATQHDQDWIDPAIESGIGGCNWARPAARPAEWDAAPVRKARPIAKPVKKPGWIWRARSTVWPKKIVVPAVMVPDPEPEPEPVAPPPAPPPPRSAIDELLHPSDAK